MVRTYSDKHKIIQNKYLHCVLNSASKWISPHREAMENFDVIQTLSPVNKPEASELLKQATEMKELVEAGREMNEAL